MKPRIEVVAIDCLMLRLFDEIAESNMPWILAASERIRTCFAVHLIDLVPSYTTMMVHYDGLALTPAQARELIAQALTDLRPETRNLGQCHVLPVWYDVSVGPELTLLAQRAGCSVSEVIRRHSEHEYQVFALGFAPGFAFMGLVEEALAAPRLNTPRKRVASGSVGGMLLPWLQGVVLATYGPYAAILLTLAGCLVMLACFGLLNRLQKRARAQAVQPGKAAA